MVGQYDVIRQAGATIRFPDGGGVVVNEIAAWQVAFDRQGRPVDTSTCVILRNGRGVVADGMTAEEFGTAFAEAVETFAEAYHEMLADRYRA